MKTLQTLYTHPLLTSEELQLICAAHEEISFSKGDYLLKKGQVANEYYCLKEGLVRVYAVDFDGNDITTAFAGEGEVVIDVLSLFHRLPAQETMQALTDCKGWKINFEKFQQLYHSVHGFSEWGRAWMSQALFQLKQRSVSMITESATDRYLALQQRYPQLLQQAPLKYIATYLGITDTSLSRIRKELSRGNR